MSSVLLGQHAILDISGVVTPMRAEALAALLRRTAHAAGATVLHEHTEVFPGGGCTAVGVLSESHVTAHTWPEYGYIAIDIFTCGDCDTGAAVATIREAFQGCDVRAHNIARKVLFAP